jgi:hypothetical protein
MLHPILIISMLATPIVEDHRGPPPMPVNPRSCLRVVGFVRCIPIEVEVLRLYGLVSGETVKPLEMIEIDKENREFLRWRKHK